MENWNPLEEHIEGRLCEKGLMKEVFDSKKDDLSRSLTLDGKLVAENLLKDPKWIKEFLFLAKKEFSKFPKETQIILWKNLINNLKRINQKK
jgi:hypothetical protein